MVLLNILAVLLLVPAALIACYYVLLALVGLWQRQNKNRRPEHVTEQSRFAILIPAHNEALTISKTLRSCKTLDYPEDKFSIFVIADNCSDTTRDIVLENKVECLVRVNNEQRGKGQALAWGFEQISGQDFDAFVIIDADCTIDAQALNVFNDYLAAGELVLQANDISSNPDDSAMSYVVSVGNVIENDLFYLAKDVLSLPVQLRGTGMVLSKTILQRYPWNAGSVVEDMEYSMALLKNGVRIRFVYDAVVSSDFPATREQLEIQRARWAGNLGLGKKDGIKLILAGIRKKSLTLFDLGLSFLVLSRPLVLGELLLAMIVSYLAVIFLPGMISSGLFTASLIIFALQAAYFTTGILLTGLNIKRLGYLFSAPFIVTRLALISFSGFLRFGKQDWAKTPRNQQHNQQGDE
jgi:cellulose synthase/poly-beta-1,6-N-acetylglucosamine synthase-like glycosyltransferase